jgi:geranylgeranyl diphosphate synthase type II
VRPAFERLASRHLPQVERALAAHAARWKASAPPRLAEAMAYSLLGGGKRLRPLLVMAAFEACGGRDHELALDLAVAVECVHTYSLVHDDLPAMDDDDLRRGRPTCHKVYGEATAILAGDALLTEAFGIVAGGPQPARVRLAALLAAGAGAAGMAGGQQLDLEAEGTAAGAGSGDLPRVEDIHRRKTGALLATCATGGAVAAGAPEERIAALGIYGSSLGLAFQIADDVLDVVGDPAAMGKTGRGDEARSKPTYASLLGVEAARGRAREARDRALAAVASLGETAEVLREMAGWAVERSS